MTRARKRADLPEGVRHGTLRAYNAFRCRCEPCTYRRQVYDREYWANTRGPVKNEQRRNERKKT